jgi:hypothetical protein
MKGSLRARWGRQRGNRSGWVEYRLTSIYGSRDMMRESRGLESVIWEESKVGGLDPVKATTTFVCLSLSTRRHVAYPSSAGFLGSDHCPPDSSNEMISPTLVPLPASPGSRRSSTASNPTLPSPELSPRTVLRPGLNRATTSATIRQEQVDPFHEGSTINVNQPVGSLSISPSSRDVCLASRKGLYILDLANLNNAPRFIPQGGTWQIAE